MTTNELISACAIIKTASVAVRNRYAKAANESSGGEQVAYGEICDAFEAFADEISEALRVEIKDNDSESD